MGRSGQTETVIITGASSGIGRATAHQFAQRGARIGLVARQREALETVKREVEQRGGEALVLPTDVSDPEQVEDAARAVDRRWGPVDVWVNNAAVTVIAPVHETRPEEFHRVQEINYLGVVYGSLAALRRMRPRNHGSIIQVGSALSYRGIPLNSAYCASQHAVKGFCDSLRTELKHDHKNIRVTLICPSGVNTPIWQHALSRMPKQPRPIGRIYQPELVARAIVWAADHDRRKLSVGYSAVKAVYLNKLAPALADWKLSRSGYQEQQQKDGAPSTESSNLWEPSAGDRGVQGPLRDSARQHSAQLWATTHVPLLAGAGAVLAAVAATFLMRKPREAPGGQSSRLHLGQRGAVSRSRAYHVGKISRRE